MLTTHHRNNTTQEYGERAKVLKLDLSANQPIAERFGIRSIPAVMFFKQGELVETIIGDK
nr:thioredoxin domain-containing protein [Chroococcidiopsis sp. SAG 2025]